MCTTKFVWAMTFILVMDSCHYSTNTKGITLIGIQMAFVITGTND